MSSRKDTVLANGNLNALQEDPFKVKTAVFNSAPQEMHTDPFQSEDPFKTDPFKGWLCNRLIFLF